MSGFRPARLRAHFFISVFVTLGCFASLARAQIVVLSSGGDFSNAAIWLPTGVPGLSNTAQIASGTLAVSDTRSVGAIDFSGGAISGGGTFTLASTSLQSTWTAGAMTGSGTTLVGPNATLTLSGAAAKNLYHGGTGSGGRALANSGTIVWRDGGNLLLGDGAQFFNRSGSLLLIQNDASIAYIGFGNDGTITNEGTLRKTTATGTTTLAQAFTTNNGLIDTQSGTMAFTAPVTAHASEFRASAGAANVFSGGQTFNTGTSFTGAGANRLAAGATVFDGTISAANLELAGGNFSGTATLGGAIEWTGGDLVGGGTFTLASGTLTLSGAADKDFYHGSTGSGGRTLDNSATVAWTGTGKILLGDGAQIVNRAGATFAVKNDATLGYIGFGSGGLFTNSGSLVKTLATGTTTLAQTFVNNGLVDAQTGTFAFTTTLTSTGEFRTTTGTANLFSGTQTFNGGTSFTGTGTNKILSGATAFNGAIAAANLEVAGGSATGTATLTGNVKWTGGDWVGGSTFTFTAGTLAIGGTAVKQLYHGGTGSGGRTVSIATGATWDGTGNILGGDGAGFAVQGGAVFDIRNDSTYGYIGFGNAPFLTNAGIVRKSGGAGTTTLGRVVLGNTGTIEVQGGTLLLNDSAVLNNDGTIDVASGTTFNFAGAAGGGAGTVNVAGSGLMRYTAGTQTLNAGAKFTGTGFSEIVGGTVNAGGAVSVGVAGTPGKLRLAAGDFGGSATVTVNNGSQFQWTGGNLTGSATLLVANGGTLLIDGAGTKQMYHGGTGSGGHTISNLGTIVWTGTGNILGGDGTQIVNQAGGVFDIQNDATLGYIGFGNGLTLTNAGTLRKSAGTGTSSLNQVFNQTGAVEVTSGTLAIAAGGTSSGTFTTTGAGLVNFTSGYTITGGNFFGASGSKISSGVTVSGATGVGSIAQTGRLTLVNGGAIAGGGTLSVYSGSTLAWTGGDMGGSGTTAILAGGQLLLSGGDVKQFYHGGTGSGGRTLSNAGTILWTGAGNLRGGDGATIANLAGGVFEVQADATLAYIGFGNGVTFANAGLFKKTAGSGVFTFNAGTFDNPGTVSVRSGTFALNASGTSTGGRFEVYAGSTLSFGANYSFDGATLAGPGQTTIASSALFFNGAATTLSGWLQLAKNSSLLGAGTLEVTGKLDWIGGAMAQAGLTKIAVGGELLLSGAEDKNLYHGGTGSGGRTLENHGLTVLDGTGALRIGDGAAIANKTGADFDLRSDTGIAYIGFGNGGTFTNSGLLQKSAGTGVSTIGGLAFTNQSTGMVWAKSGTLAFNEAVTNSGGTFQASVGATLQFGGSGTRLFDTNSTFSGFGVKQILSGTTSFNGDFNAQELVFAGGTLHGPATLHGTMTWTGGDWVGGSTFLAAAGSVLTLDGPNVKNLYHGGTGSGGRTLTNSGVLIWQGTGNLILGDGAQLINNASAIVEVRNAATLGYTGAGNPGAVTNEGLLIKTATGTTTIAQPFTQNGTGSTIVSAGTLAFTSTFTNNHGNFALDQGAALTVPGALTLGTGYLTGWGTITAPGGVSAGGYFIPEQLSIVGNLTLENSAFSAFELGGLTQGITTGAGYGFVNVTGTATLGGLLNFHFANGFESSIAPGSVFTLLSATSLNGTFANIANGQRLTNFGGNGSFQVNYGAGSAFAANSLVLSNFVPVPEPGTWAMLLSGLGACALLLRRRRLL